MKVGIVLRKYNAFLIAEIVILECDLGQGNKLGGDQMGLKLQEIKLWNAIMFEIIKKKKKKKKKKKHTLGH